MTNYTLRACYEELASLVEWSVSGMRRREFNDFTETLIGIRLQKHMSDKLGYDASVYNSLRRYAKSGEDPQKFLMLAVALRNRAIIDGWWEEGFEGVREDTYQQIKTCIGKAWTLNEGAEIVSPSGHGFEIGKDEKPLGVTISYIRKKVADMFYPLRMTWAEFNSFTKEIVGIEIQRVCSERIGSPVSVWASFRQYAESVSESHGFFRLAVEIRNKRICNNDWQVMDEDIYRRLIGFCREEYDKAFVDWEGEEMAFGDEADEADETAPPNPVADGDAKILDAILGVEAKVDGLGETLKPDVRRAAEAAESASAGVAANNALIRAHMRPRREDYAITQAGLCEILARLNCPKTEKTVKRWEAYLSTGGENGTKPPEGYSLQTRLTAESATAWAQFYAAHENAKWNGKRSLERLKGGRR